MLRGVPVRPEADHTASAIIDGLQAQTSYRIHVQVNGRTEHILSARTAPTAAADWRGRFKFVFGSCLHTLFPYGRSMSGLGNMLRHAPDFMLFIGDLIYIGMLNQFEADISVAT